jgi:UDP-N-acetylglucosamine--N-acetylmuramyl-(pentapeptide) pyrophosphoryl-undecaprenol N-acetylglucosamine transferase
VTPPMTPRVSPRMSAPTVIIAGGGTGGHVFPGLAVAEALQAMADAEVVFCGTARGLEARVIPARGFRLECLDVVPMKGGGVAKAMRGSAVALRATAQALGTVRRLAPRAVLSMGGYAAGPITLAAAILGVPVAVLEPNSLVGLANRILGRVAKRAYLAWDGAEPAFAPRIRRRYGVPLRAGFSAQPYSPSENAAPRVLVMGGSQGARPINERMPRAIARLAARHPSLEVTHQSGRGHEGAVAEAYAKEGTSRATVTPFIEDTAAAIAGSDVIVARAGAVTIAEVCAIGRAAIFIPLPHATDDHQTKNAESLAGDGAAVWLPQTAADEDGLASALDRLLADRAARIAMARAASSRGRPNAARDVAADFLELARIPPRPAASGANGANASDARGAHEAHKAHEAHERKVVAV